jgi:hypothetical protein
MWCGGQSKREQLAKLWSGELAPLLEVRPCSQEGKGLGLFAGEDADVLLQVVAAWLRKLKCATAPSMQSTPLCVAACLAGSPLQGRCVDA